MFIIRVDGRVTYNGWADRDPRITRVRSLASLSRGIARDDQLPHPHHSRPDLSMFEQSTVSSPFSSSTIAHSTLSPLALTHRVPPPGSSQQYTGSPFASVSFHPTRHGSMSNTTSSTISLDEFFALSRDARATNARVARSSDVDSVPSSSVAPPSRASPSSSSSSSRTFETRVSHRLARKTAVLARASSCAVARYRCVGNLMPTVSSSRVVTRR